MKKLHVLVLQTYVGPFVMTFFIALFILLMQFLWKYVDDLVGKGLELYIVGELLFYAGATFVPLALPLAILLSSIMTMGSLGEHYELVALKSAGISLSRTLWPLVVISGILVGVAFYFSNNIFPAANLRMGSLLYDIRQQRPAFNIMEGIYYKGIDNFVIKVQSKDDDGTTLRNIKIYDHTQQRGNVNITVAESGTMEVTDDEMYLVFTLTNGYNYQEIKPTDPGDDSQPFQRTYFTKQTRLFDLSAFNLERTDQSLFRTSFQMLNVQQLRHFDDSLTTELLERQRLFIAGTMSNLIFYSTMDSLVKKGLTNRDTANFNLTAINEVERQRFVISGAMNHIRQIKENAQFTNEELRHRERRLARYRIEFQRKFSLSFACFLMFLIGAPLGAIIRKGGFGLPMVVSVLFFIVFHVISLMGEKFAREGVLEAWQGMWMSSVVLLPIGIILFLKSTTDSAILDTDSYIARFLKIKAKVLSILKIRGN